MKKIATEQNKSNLQANIYFFPTKTTTTRCKNNNLAHVLYGQKKIEIHELYTSHVLSIFIIHIMYNRFLCYINDDQNNNNNNNDCETNGMLVVSDVNNCHRGCGSFFGYNINRNKRLEHRNAKQNVSNVNWKITLDRILRTFTTCCRDSFTSFRPGLVFEHCRKMQRFIFFEQRITNDWSMFILQVSCHYSYSTYNNMSKCLIDRPAHRCHKSLLRFDWLGRYNLYEHSWYELYVYLRVWGNIHLT